MNKTKIEWADAVWNPVTGCTKVSEGCRNCYAEGIAKRFWGERKFTSVWCHKERLSQPSKLKGKQRIFVNSMSDLFHLGVPMEMVEEVWAQMMNNPQHTFMILTKRADRMAEAVDLMLRDGFGVLPNVWLGVSVENQKTADERIPLLLQTPAAVRFVSCEPLLGPVDLGLLGTIPHSTPYNLVYQKLNWVICGGESGTRARPMHPDWVRSLRDQCQEAGVPFFFKQWGTWGDSIKHLVYGFDHGSVKYLNPDGSFGTQKDWYYGNAVAIAPDGKRANGRKLDGREWNEFPEVEE